MESLAELEIAQSRILDRITALELALLPPQDSLLSTSTQDQPHHEDCPGDTESRLFSILRAGGVQDFAFKRVPMDYYDRTLEARREIIGAPTIHHLCKSIVMINTQAQASVTDCSDYNNSKYYVIVIQYSARLNAESVKNFLYSLNNGKIPKKKFNMRLAPEAESLKLTGYEHNGVTCIGMKTDIPGPPVPLMHLHHRHHHLQRPSLLDVAWTVQTLGIVILDEAIAKLDPDFFWLGGGEVDLKLGIRTSQFIDFIKPFIVSCST